MAIGHRNGVQSGLDLPVEYQDLDGLIRADLKAIVGALTDRAQERLLLSRREALQLRQKLWDNLSAAVRDAMDPLTAERR